MDQDLSIKECRICHHIKSIVEFPFRKDKQLYRTECISCHKILEKQYRLQNSHKKKQWCLKNPEKQKTINHRHYLKYSLKRLTYQKQYHLQNKEHDNLYQKQYRKNHPLKRQEWCRKYNRKRRAMKQCIHEHYTLNDEKYTMNLFNHCCANCGSTKELTIDHHYPLLRGHALTRNNAVVLCLSCNSSKGFKMPENFYTKKELQKIEKLLGIKHQTD